MTIRQQKAFAVFVREGYSREGAAAIVGNLSQESGENLDSTVERVRADNGSGGIAEWRLERKANLYLFASRMGTNVNDLEVQCLFVIHELESGDDGRNRAQYEWLNYQLINSSGRTIENLTANFCAAYERPNTQAANLDNRIAQAKRVLRESSLPQIPSPTRPPTMIEPQKDLVDELKELAELQRKTDTRMKEIVAILKAKFDEASAIMASMPIVKE